MKKITRVERNAMVEKVKTAIIVLLCVSCVYLLNVVLGLYKGHVSMGTFFWGTENTKGLSSGQDNASKNVVNTFWQLSEPSELLAVSGNDRRIIKKTTSDYPYVMEKINITIRDMYLVKATDVLASDENQWKNCLTEGAVYIRHNTPRATELEGSFYGVKDSAFGRAIGSYREMMFVPDSQQKSLLKVYVKDAKDGKFVRLNVKTDTDVLEKALEVAGGKGREFDFGFEIEDADDGIASMMIVPTGQVETNNIVINVPRIYKGGINFAKTTEVTSGLINIFGYNLNTVRQYENTDGALIYVGETGSLSLHPMGRIEYKALGENEGVPLATSGTDFASTYSMVAGIAEVIEKIYKLSGIEDEKNHAVLKITDFRQDGMKLDYFVDGLRVSMGKDAAVSAVIKNSVLVEFKMWVKAIEKTENTVQNSPLLKEIYEYYKLNPGVNLVNGGELIYNYKGDDAETSAVWYIQGEL